MTLARELEYLRTIARMRLGDPMERERMLTVIDLIKKRFKKIEDALR